MRKLISAIFILAAIFVVVQCRGGVILASEVYQPPVVRIAVIKDAQQLELSIKSAFKIMPLEADEALYEAKVLDNSPVKPVPWGIKIADAEFKVYGIRIISLNDSTIFINKRSFRGEVDIIKQSNQMLLVVNYVNVEDYLRGVLYMEVSHWWPMNALKVQAIAARTFALYQATLNKNKPYDLESTVYSQVYGGSSAERKRTDDAVFKTQGKILTYNGRFFPAFYHATCGGHTEDASTLWKTDLYPLKGVACNFCRHSPHFYWRRKITVRDIEEALSIKNIKEITPKTINNSGRIVLLQIRTSDKTMEISAKDFRQKLGSNFIKSTIFKINIRPATNGQLIAYIEGVGWGHGVGLCQWGAFGMALKGYKAEEILEYYYPGAKIEMYDGQR